MQELPPMVHDVWHQGQGHQEQSDCKKKECSSCSRCLNELKEIQEVNQLASTATKVTSDIVRKRKEG